MVWTGRIVCFKCVFVSIPLPNESWSLINSPEYDIRALKYSAGIMAIEREQMSGKSQNTRALINELKRGCRKFWLRGKSIIMSTVGSWCSVRVGGRKANLTAHSLPAHILIAPNFRTRNVSEYSLSANLSSFAKSVTSFTSQSLQYKKWES